VVTDSIARAWREHAEALSSFGEFLTESAYFRGEAMRAAAFRGLAKTLAAAYVQHVVEYNPLAPRLLRADFGFPNPDNIYLATPLDDAGSYRVFGRIGTANQTFFSLYQSTPEGSGLAGARVRAEQLVRGPAGDFELWMTRERRPDHTNWLPLEPGTTSMSIYQIFADWDRETKGWFGIERVDTAGCAPELATQEELARRLRALAATVGARLRYWQQIDDRVAKGAAKNEAAQAYRNSVSSLDIYFSPGLWAIGEDEALIVEFEPPAEASYWGFSVSDFWSEPLDYLNRQGSLNCAQARRDGDGRFRLVLAHRDPGVPNWIDIAGHPEGIFNWRVTTTRIQDRPTARLLRFDALRQHLPAETPSLSGAQRRESIRARQRHAQYRYSL
jgi:hypothetical protein